GVEVLFIDMPPGTGDIQLTLSQIASLYGVILVTTPQRMSTSDVAKAGRMFEKVKVPILGIIENMVDSKTVKLFGSGGAGELATRLNTEIMGHIELNPEFVTYSDSGKPVTLSDHGKVFFELASKLIEKLEQIENTSVEIVDN
ncbi:MAG: P-loop NTPase, partial [Thermoplasmatales archaeon]